MKATLALIALVSACTGCHHGHAPPERGAVVATAPMAEVGIAIPIAPGKTAAWQAALEDLIGPRYTEYDTSRRRYGLTSQTTFLQRTPMGDFALIHLTGADVHASFHAMSSSQDPWDVRWRELTQSLHGMDFAKGDRVVPKVELAYTTGAGDGGGHPFMFLAPLDGDDGVAKFRALAAAITGERHDAYVHARAGLGVHREAVFLESTPMGVAAVFYWEADDPLASLRAIAASREPFDVWLRARVGGMHPIGLDAITAIASSNMLVAQYPHAR